MIKLYFSAILATLTISGFTQDIRNWATYYGGTSNEGFMATASDPWGNIYCAGITSGNGLAFNGHQMSFGGGNVDAFLVKFSPSGGRIWATYYGGGGDEQSFFPGRMGLCTDETGNVYLSGLTNSTNAIASPGAFQTAIGGGVDAYLVKFDSAGVRQWGTYYGGTSMDNGYDCAPDGYGNIYLCGRTGSTGLAAFGYQNTLGGQTDAFLVKFDNNGNRVWATYFGGTMIEEGFSVTIDQSHNVYLGGSIGTTSGIITGGYQTTFGGGNSDAFIAKFDNAGFFLWSTYAGGLGEEWAMQTSDLEMVCGPANVLYVCGYTESTNGFGFNGHQNTNGGGTYDAFLMKLDSTGNRVWSTYYGGSGEEMGHGVATDSAGNVFLSGSTTSTSGIALAGFQTALATGPDGYLVKFNPQGIRLCATYFGGNDYDTFEECAVGPDGTISCGGNMATQSGLTFNGFQNSFGGGSSDAFLVKFTPCNDLLSIDGPTGNSVSVFPNPSAGKFTVNSGRDNSTVEIRNALGEVVMTKVFNTQAEIDLSNCAAGIYYCRIITGGNYSDKLLILE